MTGISHFLMPSQRTLAPQGPFLAGLGLLVPPREYRGQVLHVGSQEAGQKDLPSSFLTQNAVNLSYLYPAT